MIFTGVGRIGRDAELRTAGSEVVINLSLAFNYGRKGADGNRPTQWVDAALWGKQAEVLEPYLKKGGQVFVAIRELHIESFQGKNGEGHKLAGTITQIELVGPKQDSQQAGQSGGQQQSAPPAQQQQAAPAGQNGGFADDFSDDIPF